MNARVEGHAISFTKVTHLFDNLLGPVMTSRTESWENEQDAKSLKRLGLRLIKWVMSKEVVVLGSSPRSKRYCSNAPNLATTVPHRTVQPWMWLLINPEVISLQTESLSDSFCFFFLFFSFLFERGSWDKQRNRSTEL